MTALQKNAEKSQKWPLLNLVRQKLKSNQLHLRKSNGYSKDGKKVFAIFCLKKIKTIKNNTEVNNK